MCEVVFQKFLMDEGSKETRLSTFWRIRPLANHGGRGSAEILEPRSSSCCQRSLSTLSSLLHCVVMVSMFRDFWFILPQCVAASLVLTVAAAAVIAYEF